MKPKPAIKLGHLIPKKVQSIETNRSDHTRRPLTALQTPPAAFSGCKTKLRPMLSNEAGLIMQPGHCLSLPHRTLLHTVPLFL